MEIEIPPLRQRKDDIIPLAQFFLRRGAQKQGQSALLIEPDAKRALQAYSWPGNVRELSHVIERAQILCGSSSITAGDLGLEVQKNNAMPQPDPDSGVQLKSLAEAEADLLKERFAHFEGDALRTAESLGLSRSAFYRRLSKAKEYAS